MLPDVPRRVGPVTGLGISRVDFDFKIFASSNVLVIRTSKAGVDKTLKEGEDYTVTWDEDQTANVGGYITLNEFLLSGESVTILSDVAYTQELDLHAEGDFNPQDINDNFDRTEAQIQQLKEKLSRAAIAPASSGMNGDDYGEILLDNSTKSGEYAKAAAASAAEAKKSRDDILEHQQEVIAAVTAEGDKQEQRLVGEGDTQIARIKAEADNTFVVNGTGCVEKFWTLSADTPAGTDIVIPSGIKYLVNRHHLRVSWNGLVLAIGQNFTEVGAEDTFSDTFRLTFDAKAGDELDIWIGAIGTGDVSQALALAGEASAAVADLSRKVVYKESSQPL